jgi:repressor LexA
VEAFRQRVADGEPPPTHRELCRQFGWKSTGTARDHIRALVQKGILSPADRRSRGASLVAKRPEGKLLPVVGRIVAGQPLLSEEHIEKEILVPIEFVPRGKAFVLRVTGDSMEGVGIFPDDYVIVLQAKAPTPGCVIAVTVEGESTLRLLQQRDGKWFLLAANAKYPPIEIQSPAVIHGVVTAVMRHIREGSPQTGSWTSSIREQKE